MQSYILRCKHCNKTYSSSEAGCSMDYCPECQKAIDEALRKIPVKFEGRFQPINEPRLFPLFDKIRSDVKDRRKDSFNFGEACKIYCCGKYDNCDTYTHNGLKFNVEYNDSTPNDRHVSVVMEYDLIEKKFTGNPWKIDLEDNYIHGRNMSRELAHTISGKTYEPKPMPEPTGMLFFNDALLWDVIQPNKGAPKPKEHKLHSYKTHANGSHIKSDCENGQGCEHKRVFLENFDKNSLIDFLEYEYTVEYYEDENMVYYKDMRCI